MLYVGLSTMTTLARVLLLAVLPILGSYAQKMTTNSTTAPSRAPLIPPVAGETHLLRSFISTLNTTFSSVST